MKPRIIFEFVADITVWPHGIFDPLSYILEVLLKGVKKADFQFFVFSFDGVRLIGEAKERAVRDNVLFELGLFMGKIGRERTGFIASRVPRGPSAN